MEFFIQFGFILIGTLAIMKIAPKVPIGVAVTVLALGVFTIAIRLPGFFGTLLP